MGQQKGSSSYIISSLHRAVLIYILTTPCSRIFPLFLFVSIPSQVHYVHVILTSISGIWYTCSLYLGREENQGVDNPEPMENEEQAIQETGENSLQ